ncbi:hypothetical protein CAOG_009830 [Capsaspora owczarzaki ATCC 30864]|uniref:Uncharacterized protein n=1 Tax=Capsaspora owczarzaki (strain ATCC 30864) TaxID=595528 RepID=A0A0D2X3N2_CAPO3|nr:hypothetical protein CAOG_009830 [Capsaspora owczarzaki ATCC 30864]
MNKSVYNPRGPLIVALGWVGVIAAGAGTLYWVNQDISNRRIEALKAQRALAIAANSAASASGTTPTPEVEVGGAAATAAVVAGAGRRA